MDTVLRGAAVGGLLAAALAFPICGQTKNWSATFQGAYIEAGTLAQSRGTELQLENQGSLGGSFERWLVDSWFGLRLSGAYMSAPWILDFNEDGDGDGLDDPPTMLREFGDVGVTMGDASVLVRLLHPKTSRSFAPFVSAGGGFMRWDPDNEGGKSFDLRVPEADVQIEGDAQTEPVLTLSLGADVFWNEHIAFRFEAKDFWNLDSPYTVSSQVGAPPEGNVSRHHDGSHNVAFTVGLSYMFGGGRVVEPGFLVALPEPPTAAPVAAAEQVTMCVVDESGRLQALSATRTVTTGEITVLHEGRALAFAEAHPSAPPRYVSAAGWLVAGRPLVVGRPRARTAEGNDAAGVEPAPRLELIGLGAPQTIPSRELVSVGSLEGTPLFASAAEVGTLRAELEARLRISSDLDYVLSDEEFADRFVQRVQRFYAALQPGLDDCVFQPVEPTRRSVR